MANSNMNFHSQLRSVMDTLAMAAVKEISNLVDDGFAILHLEISHSQKENEALKYKLQAMELQIARGCIEESGLREQLAKCRCGGGLHNDDSPFQSTDNVFGNRLDITSETDGEATFGQDTPAQPTAMKDECASVEEGSTEVVIIKEEGEEEVRDPLGEMNTREERALERRAGRREKRPVEETQNKAANHTAELTEQHRNRRAVWETSDGKKRSLTSLHIKEEEPEEVLGNTELRREQENSEDRLEKSSSVTCTRTRHRVWESGESVTSNQRAPCRKSREAGAARGEKQRAQRRNAESLGSEPIPQERPGQLGTLLPQMTSDPQFENPSCSFSAETGAESLQVHPEQQSVPVMVEGAGDKLSALSSLEWDSELVDFVPVEEQAGMFAAWSEEALSERALTQLRLYGQIQDKEETIPENNARVPFGKHLAVSKNYSVQERIGGGVKQFSYPTFENGSGSFKDSEFQQITLTEEGMFSCIQCGKSFTKLCDLKGHQRVHTGEKPFACSQCDKCFSYHHQLKTHRRTHTGEKPFICTQCGKGFTQSSHIKRHQAVHTGEKRFSCKLCGKRFSQSSGLKTHQAVHTGERPFSCSQCGKSFSIFGNLLRHQIVHTGK